MWAWLVGSACTACGSVQAPGSGGTPPDGEPPPDGDGRDVACNGRLVDILPNGNFDAIDPAWQQDPPSPGLLCGQPRITPDSGAVAACLGGSAEPTTHEVSRDVFLPLGANKARLTGRICIATEEVDPLDNDVLTFELLDGELPIATLGRRTNRQGNVACGFTDFVFSDVPVTRDPKVATFRIRAQLDLGKSTTFYVDTLTLTVTCD